MPSKPPKNGVFEHFFPTKINLNRELLNNPLQVPLYGSFT